MRNTRLYGFYVRVRGEKPGPWIRLYHSTGPLCLFGARRFYQDALLMYSLNGGPFEPRLRPLPGTSQSRVDFSNVDRRLG